MGYQHRREEGGDIADPITAAGDATGSAQGPTGGVFNVNAAYAELGIPLALGLPGIESLELNAAVRWVDFSSFGSELTWKFGGRYQILEHVALRGTASRSFRAPSVNELFQGAQDNFPNITDPCNEPQNNPGCMEVGLSVNDDRTQIRSTIAGNPDLDAETANTFTYGIVITPKFGKWTEGLSLTVDYWDISIDNAVQLIGEAVILSNCYGRTGDARENCDLVTRSQNGVIVDILNTQTNVGGVDTAGIDFGLNYRIPTNFGRFALSFDATWLQKFDVTQSDGSVIEGAGTYDLRDVGTNAGVYANILFNTSLRYNIENFGAGVNVNYTGPIRECDNNSCAEDANGVAPPSRDVESFVTTDVFASYRVSSPLGVSSLSAGINNVTDAVPPTIYNGFLANSDAAAYDYIGRYFYFRVSQTF